jgi:signal transduction histidine kinase
MMSLRRIFTYVFRIAILFAVYFIAAKFGFGLAYSAKQITLVWPPAGIALALTLIWGFSVWPGIFLGALIVNFSTSGLFLLSLGIAAGNTFAALLGAFLLRRTEGFDQSFARVNDYLRFIFLGAMAPTLASAFFGVSILTFSHVISVASWEDFFFFFRLWWVSDMMGVLVFAPVFLVWPHVRDIIKDKKRLTEAAILFFVTAFSGFFIFNPATHYFIVILVPLILWAIIRFYQPGVAFMTLFLLAVSIFGTIGGFGLFANIGSLETNLLLAQIFLGIISAGTMMVALSAFEGKKSVEDWKKLSLMLHEKISEQAEKLAAHAHKLEKKVAERTDELNSANNSLQKEVARRDRFLATLSHELRNPLSPIISAVEIIRMMNIGDEELRKLFEIIERQANQMTRLLKDLLDVSRILHQKIDLHIEPIDVANIMKAAIETTRPLFSHCEHNLSVSFPEKPLLVSGDALRIEQIIVNLLNNAAKYTPKGGHISLDAKNAGGKAVITVRDNGIGISAKMIPEIFTLFSQDEDSLKMAKGGMGLGLAITKNLVELHGGEITARSEGHEKGATFTVTLPIAPS